MLSCDLENEGQGYHLQKLLYFTYNTNVFCGRQQKLHINKDKNMNDDASIGVVVPSFLYPRYLPSPPGCTTPCPHFFTLATCLRLDALHKPYIYLQFMHRSSLISNLLCFASFRILFDLE